MPILAADALSHFIANASTDDLRAEAAYLESCHGDDDGMGCSENSPGQENHSFEFTEGVSERSDELFARIHRWVDAFRAKHPGKVIKIGSAYLRLAKIRTNNQQQYPRSDFDNSSAEIFPFLLLNDTVGSQAEGGGIEYARECGVSVNVRTEKAGSFSRNRKRGDVGFTEGDPGVIYIIATKYSTIDDFFRNYVSYHMKQHSYPPERYNENGRLKPLTYADGRQTHKTYENGRQTHKTYENGRQTHTNSVTGEEGAMTYEDGREIHPTNETGRKTQTNSVTGEEGAMTYAEGRKKPTNSVTGEEGAMTYAEGRQTRKSQNGLQILNDAEMANLLIKRIPTEELLSVLDSTTSYRPLNRLIKEHKVGCSRLGHERNIRIRRLISATLRPREESDLEDNEEASDPFPGAGQVHHLGHGASITMPSYYSHALSTDPPALAPAVPAPSALPPPLPAPIPEVAALAAAAASVPPPGPTSNEISASSAGSRKRPPPQEGEAAKSKKKPAKKSKKKAISSDSEADYTDYSRSGSDCEYEPNSAPAATRQARARRGAAAKVKSYKFDESDSDEFD